MTNLQGDLLVGFDGNPFDRDASSIPLLCDQQVSDEGANIGLQVVLDEAYEPSHLRSQGAFFLVDLQA